MAGFLVVLFPIALLGFILFMQKVEEPLRTVTTEEDIARFLDDANPEELDTLVREGTDSAVRRFRNRLRLRRPRNGRRRTSTTDSTGAGNSGAQGPGA
ncbi:hypothetical protein SAMN05444157_3771 [Frankineae bacterium MT45]|nr:hypothetical protein SAMN05444157_3771 [Frankineae bacterium MT45]